MDWITQEYVKAEAKKGRKRAIECTQLHWQQLVKAEPKELDKALNCKDKVTIFISHCSLCLRYYYTTGKSKRCIRCPLECMTLWLEVNHYRLKWANNPTCTNWRKWKQAAKAMLAKIDRLHERLYGSNQ